MDPLQAKEEREEKNMLISLTQTRLLIKEIYLGNIYL